MRVSPVFGIAAVARPGDTVIIGFAAALTGEDVAELEEFFSGFKEKGIEVHFADQVSSIAVIREEDESDARTGE